jgi:hypothetical protein
MTFLLRGKLLFAGCAKFPELCRCEILHASNTQTIVDYPPHAACKQMDFVGNTSGARVIMGDAPGTPMHDILRYSGDFNE